jgi:formylglycine-generating enzyme required for sulfatase activity
MVRVPGGTFRLGANEGYGFHSPQHLITVAPFEIDTTEVTLAAYRQCVNAGACVQVANESVCNWGKDGRDNDPINCVEYKDAVAYCKWAGKRLPTEEEWEFAALGQSGWKYPWGNDPPGARPCWKGPGHARPIGEREGTCPVDRFPEDKSQFGVRNLVGNVSEWTSSLVCSYPKKEHKCEPDTQIIRGGAWGDPGSGVSPYLRKFVRNNETRTTGAPSRASAAPEPRRQAA